MSGPSGFRSPANAAKRRSDTPALESVADVIEWLRRSFRAERAGELSISYQFELSGEAGGTLWARVDHGRVEAQAGRLPVPDVLLRLAASDLFGVLAGRANPDLLFMEKKIEVEGDLLFALKLRSLFRTGG